MDFLWPSLLVLLGLLPLTVAIYIWVLRRQSRFAVRYSSLSLVKESLTGASKLRRHLPFVFFLLALTSLVLAMGRPITPQSVLSGRTTIILALDVSTSMCMKDIPPNRLEAAKEAARWFVENPVLGTQIGIVAFAGFAELAQEPTTEPALLKNSINNLTTTTRTAIGSAILTSLDAIAEVDKSVAPSEEKNTLPSFSPEQLPEPRFSEEDYVPHIIVLLTDGASNTGPSPLSAAQQAVERGVRIYPIGFGTANNGIMDCWSLYGNDPVGNSASGSQSGGSFGSGADEETLKQIAKMTGGEFYSATSATELQTVFQSLHSLVAMTNTTIEISVIFAVAGVIIAMIAFILSMLWHPLL